MRKHFCLNLFGGVELGLAEKAVALNNIMHEMLFTNHIYASNVIKQQDSITTQYILFFFVIDNRDDLP